MLMKNNGALPLDPKSQVTTPLGRAGADPVYGGSGSGAVKLDTVIDPKSGLENAGLRINGAVYDLLPSLPPPSPEASSPWISPRNPPTTSARCLHSGYTAEAVSSFSDYGDAAIGEIAAPAARAAT